MPGGPPAAGPPAQAGGISPGPLDIDPAARTAVLAGKTLTLSRLEFGVLHFLALRRGRVQTAEEIHRAVWVDRPPVASPRATVTEHVGRVRVSLGEHGRMIVNVLGVGWRWDGPPVTPPPPTTEAGRLAAGLADGVRAVARVLADMPEADRADALGRLRGDPVVCWMAGVP